MDMTLPLAETEQKEFQVRLVPKTGTGELVGYVFQLHRDETPNLVRFVRDALGERTPESALIEDNKCYLDPRDVLQPASAEDADASVALGVSGYASDETQGKLEEEAAIVDYTPDSQDRMLIAMWDEMFNAFPIYPNPVARTLAVSCIRQGLKTPGKAVFYKHMSQLAGGPIVQKSISSILSCSGLWRFAKFDDRSLVFTAPEEGNDVYDWARLREQFLVPVEELKIEVHQLPEASVTNIPADPKLGEGLREALEVCQRLDATCPIGHHPAHPKEPHLK